MSFLLPLLLIASVVWIFVAATSTNQSSETPVTKVPGHFKKCCNWNESFEGAKCRPQNRTLAAATLFANLSTKNYEKSIDIENSHIRVEKCPGMLIELDPNYPDDEYLLQANGYLIGKELNTTEHCLEFVNERSSTMVFVCYTSLQGDCNFNKLESNQKPYIITEFMCIGWASSVIFLCLTLLIYTIVRELRNLQAKCLICYVICLIVGDSFLFTMNHFLSASCKVCTLTAFVVQFSFLASFFWLNVMCFDLWWNIGDHRSFNNSSKNRDLKKFLIYCVYAWGIPALITTFTLFAQFHPNFSFFGIKPEYGVTKCWFKDGKALFWYFYSFISVILVSNLFMFICTTMKLNSHKRSTNKVLKRSGSQRHNNNDKQRFFLYLKLFIVMGVNWMMEVISYCVGGQKEIWYFFDILNTLQGVMIFIIFVCKRRVLFLLNLKLYPKENFFARDSRNNNSNSQCSTFTVVNGTSSSKPNGNARNNKLQLSIMNNETVAFGKTDVDSPTSPMSPTSPTSLSEYNSRV